jgi:hypothetical protein
MPLLYIHTIVYIQVYIYMCVCVCVCVCMCICVYIYICAGMSGNTETMQMLELLEHTYLPNLNDLPTNVQHFLHPLSQTSYLMPIPFQSPSSCHRIFKILACKKGMLSPL